MQTPDRNCEDNVSAVPAGELQTQALLGPSQFVLLCSVSWAKANATRWSDANLEDQGSKPFPVALFTEGFHLLFPPL